MPEPEIQDSAYAKAMRLLVENSRRYLAEHSIGKANTVQIARIAKMLKASPMVKTTMILSNQVLCRLCGDAPYSASRNDFRSCRCGKVSVDGGQAYLRRSYADDAVWVDISIEWSMQEFTDIHNAIDDIYVEVISQREELANKADITMRDLAHRYIELRNLDVAALPIYYKAVEWGFNTSRNAMGLVFALARTERDGDFYVTT